MIIKYYDQLTATQKEKIENITKFYQERHVESAGIVIRQSGTEPIIRIMTESHQSDLAKNLLAEIQVEIENELK